MRSLKIIAAMAAIAAPLLLAACGGGGGSSAGRGAPPFLSPGTVDPARTQLAVSSAAARDPQSGSVYQTSDNRATAVTYASNTVRVTAGALDLNSADHLQGSSGLSSSITGRSDRIVGLVKSTPTSLSGAAVLVSWSTATPAEWLAAGYWLHATGDHAAGTISSIHVGAFADGPELDARSSMPSTGSATYRGVAGGIYAYGNPAGSVRVGEAQGAVQLTANFATGTIHGGIGGLADGVDITLGSTTFTQQGWINPGDVSVRIGSNTFSNAGGWGGRFSKHDKNGVPRLVAGTAGARWTEPSGNQGSFIGAFVAAN